MAVSARQPRGQHRAQRQGHERRDHDRDGEHEAELREQPARDAGQKGNGQEHRNQGRRRGQDREEHLPGSDHGRGERLHALGALPVDVLDHDDRVVDDHAGRENQGQERQDIDREPEQPDRGHGPDQRDGDGHRRNQRRANGPHKEEDDHDDNADSDAKADNHFAHGAANESRIVRDLDDLDIVQAPVQALDGPVDRSRDLDGVGFRPPDDAEADHLATVQQAVALRLRRAIEGLRHVAQPDIVAQGEPFHVGGTPDRGIGAHQKKLIARFEAPRRHVQTGASQDLGDVIDRQAIAGEPHRLDDDPQHPLLIAEQRDRGDTRDRRQLGGDVILGEAGQRFL